MQKKILIADDEPNIIVPLQFLMEQNGYDVHVAVSGEKVIELIETLTPDLILLDIMLPYMDGFEVCQIIRERSEYQHIKIIFITAMGRDVDVAKGIALGADAFITKPFSNSDVVEKVRKLLTTTNV